MHNHLFNVWKIVKNKVVDNNNNKAICSKMIGLFLDL